VPAHLHHRVGTSLPSTVTYPPPSPLLSPSSCPRMRRPIEWEEKEKRMRLISPSIMRGGGWVREGTPTSERCHPPPHVLLLSPPLASSFPVLLPPSSFWRALLRRNGGGGGNELNASYFSRWEDQEGIRMIQYYTVTSLSSSYTPPGASSQAFFSHARQRRKFDAEAN
jgi:hypothetical protein